MRKFQFVSLLLIISLIFTACGQKEEAIDTWKELKDRGTIIVGLDDTFVPMGFRDKDGKLTGFDIDLAREAIERLGLELELQAIDWNLKEQELISGNIDLIWNAYTITDSRLEKVNFTKPYLDNKQLIVVLSDSDIDSKDDLKDKIVCTQNSSSALDAIEKSGAKEDFKDGDLVLFDTYTEA
ncbi:MAG TPA: transporter substrate-binding domain-containing protein, partial [Tissierellaceae bacterium]|nr:transporter substrate-binding domain-containing protein [Tissierellaceae bacterium]